jgi:hypothetical protein
VGKRAKIDSEVTRLNLLTYLQYYNKFKSLAMSIFKWNNLPNTIDERYLELQLFEKGQVLFFYDEVLGHLTLPFVGERLDIYNEPTTRRVHSPNGYQNVLNAHNSVIIYNNYIHTSSTDLIELYSKRLSNIERTIDVNLESLKTPVIITCTETQRLTLLNLMQETRANTPFIFGDESLKLNDSITVLDLNATYHADKLQVLKTQLKNELLTELGISNGSFNKKERMLSAEVELNTGDINAQKYTRLGVREIACNQINEMFSLNVSVEFREDVINKLMLQEELKGDEI